MSYSYLLFTTVKDLSGVAIAMALRRVVLKKKNPTVFTVGMSTVTPSYIRIKRHKQTIFLHCDLHNDTVLVLKERIEKLTDVPVLQQRLLLGKQALELNTSLWDCGIEKEDAELLLVLSTGEDQWEDPVEAAEGPQQQAEGTQP